MSRKNGTTQSSRSSTRSMTSHDRKLRYRALLEDLSTIEDDADSDTQCMERTSRAVREARQILDEGGSYDERAMHPGEGYLDSRVLKATSDLAVRCSEAVSGNANIYDRHELAEHMRQNPSFWTWLFPREVPQLAFLFGTFAPTAPELRPRAPRRRAERQALAELKAPEMVDKLEKTEEGSEVVSKVMHFINKAYRKGANKPLSYFHVVLDPGSFSRTVENVYHVSFLVKDGMVAVKLDDDSGLPFITPVQPAQRELELAGENQFIVSIDMQRWQDLVEAFRIQKPMLVIKR